MKSTGIVRKVDELGRIVLPKELRQTLNINERIQLRFLWTTPLSYCKNMNQHACFAITQTIWCNIWAATFVKNV